MPSEGFEPSCREAPGPEPGVYANSTTTARGAGDRIRTCNAPKRPDLQSGEPTSCSTPARTPGGTVVNAGACPPTSPVAIGTDIGWPWQTSYGLPRSSATESDLRLSSSARIAAIVLSLDFSMPTRRALSWWA